MADSLNPNHDYHDYEDTWHGTHKDRVWTVGT